jgi:hypothetical protein
VGVQTLTSSPSQASSSSGGGSGAGAGGGKKKVKTGAIVGGVLGGLLFLGALGVICVVCIGRMERTRHRGNLSSKLRVDPQATFVPPPTDVGVGNCGGRAELGGDGKGGVLGRENLDMSAGEKGVEIDGRGVRAQGGGDGRCGLRSEGLDSQGRYVGELHGDGRQGGGFELQGTEVVR